MIFVRREQIAANDAGALFRVTGTIEFVSAKTRTKTRRASDCRERESFAAPLANSFFRFEICAAFLEKFKMMNQRQVVNVIVRVVVVAVNDVIPLRRLPEMKSPNVVMQIMFSPVKLAVKTTVFIAEVKVTAKLLNLFIDHENFAVAPRTRFVAIKIVHDKSPSSVAIVIKFLSVDNKNCR